MKFNRKDYQESIVDLRTEAEGSIPRDEPVFLLRAKDKVARLMVARYAREAQAAGASPEMVGSAMMQAQAMQDWADKHGSKTPDLPEDSSD